MMGWNDIIHIKINVSRSKLFYYATLLIFLGMATCVVVRSKDIMHVQFMGRKLHPFIYQKEER